MSLIYKLKLIVFGLAIFGVVAGCGGITLDSTKDCDQFTTLKFRRTCGASFTPKLKAKYRDHRVKQKEPYVLFQATTDESKYFISYKESILHDCRTLTIKDELTFECDGEEKKLKEANMFCFQISIQIFEELLYTCGEENEKNYVRTKSKGGVFHYTIANHTNLNVRINHILYIFTSAIYLFVHNYWSL